MLDPILFLFRVLYRELVTAWLNITIGGIWHHVACVSQRSRRGNVLSQFLYQQHAVTFRVFKSQNGQAQPNHVDPVPCLNLLKLSARCACPASDSAVSGFVAAHLQRVIFSTISVVPPVSSPAITIANRQCTTGIPEPCCSYTICSACSKTLIQSPLFRLILRIIV